MKKGLICVILCVLLALLAGCGEAKVSSEQAAQIASDRATVVEGIPIKKHGVEYWWGLEGADQPGGIDACLEEQDAVRRAAGLRPVIVANVELSVGETYLFCVHITEDGRVLHHTLLQFAFPDESDDAAVIRRVCAAEQ